MGEPHPMEATILYRLPIKVICMVGHHASIILFRGWYQRHPHLRRHPLIQHQPPLQVIMGRQLTPIIRCIWQPSRLLLWLLVTFRGLCLRIVLQLQVIVAVVGHQQQPVLPFQLIYRGTHIRTTITTLICLAIMATTIRRHQCLSLRSLVEMPMAITPLRPPMRL